MVEHTTGDLAKEFGPILEYRTRGPHGTTLILGNGDAAIQAEDLGHLTDVQLRVMQVYLSMASMAVGEALTTRRFTHDGKKMTVLKYPTIGTERIDMP